MIFRGIISLKGNVLNRMLRFERELTTSIAYLYGTDHLVAFISLKFRKDQFEDDLIQVYFNYYSSTEKDRRSLT